MVKHNFIPKFVDNNNSELTEEDKNERISLESQKSEKYLQHLKEIKRNRKLKRLTHLGHYRVWVNIVKNNNLMDDFNINPITMKISVRPIKEMLNILSNLKLFRG
tara:strand:+ start:355 stop:669 length:315 start_codon:yes stop_codon:yes gene_type:complete